VLLVRISADMPSRPQQGDLPMTRPLRIDFDGAVHHVMNRGANHQLTFRDDEDRRLFLDIVGEAVRRFGIEVHAYCLMPNHYHLLLRSPSSQLSRALKHIGQVYTQRFNRRHGRDGALFRGRFHSILVDSDKYLDTVARYIHLNPVTKDMTNDDVLDTFEWSSFASYEGRSRGPKWLTKTNVLERFANPSSYGEFVRSKLTNFSASRFYEAPFAQRLALGDSRFVERVRKQIDRPEARIQPGMT